MKRKVMAKKLAEQAAPDALSVVDREKVALKLRVLPQTMIGLAHDGVDRGAEPPKDHGTHRTAVERLFDEVLHDLEG